MKGAEWDYLYYTAMAQRSIRFVCTLICLLWLFRLWRRCEDSTYLWMLLGFFLIPIIMIQSATMGFPYKFPLGLFPDLSFSVKMVVLDATRFLFRSAQYLCVFIALSKLSNRAMPFSEIAAPLVKPVLKLIEPLRVKMP